MKLSEMLKNSWKVLPVVGLINDAINHGGMQRVTKKTVFHTLYSLTAVTYLEICLACGGYTPTQWNENLRIKKEAQSQTPLPKSTQYAVFRNDDGTTQTLYFNPERNYFSLTPDYKLEKEQMPRGGIGR